MIVFGIMTLGDLCFGDQETPVHIYLVLGSDVIYQTYF